MAKKKAIAVVKLQIRAGQATPAPPVGTALGQHGVNIMEFCRQYNEQTQQQAGQVIPAELTIYEDRSFSFITKQPPAAELIKQAAGLDAKTEIFQHEAAAVSGGHAVEAQSDAHRWSTPTRQSRSKRSTYSACASWM